MLHPVFSRKRIFAPGPTPVPEEVLSQISFNPLHHRTSEFEIILGRVLEGLKFLFQTQHKVYVLCSSGTGAMEASIVNHFKPKDEVLVIKGGKFGERWEKIAKSYDLNCHVLDVTWGEACDPNQIKILLQKNKNIRGVFFQASETSTGVSHPTQEISDVVKKNSDALVIVDAITALGVESLPQDEWNLDIVVSGSQKALMLPPGLSFIGLSDKALQRRKQKELPSFYFNLDFDDKTLPKETSWTPAVNLICGLDLILQEIKKVGLKPIIQHHTRLALATRESMKAMSLELFAKSSPSNAVTAVCVPKGVDGNKIVSILRDKFGITIAGGQDHLKGKIFRLGHLGYFDGLDICTIVSAVGMTLKELGHACDLGKAVHKACDVLMKE